MGFPSNQQDDLDSYEQFIAPYFGNTVPENELQERIMRTYADAFESLRVPPSSRPTGADILKTITDAHTPSELFSHMVICNPRIASKARTQLESIGLLVC